MITSRSDKSGKVLAAFLVTILSATLSACGSDSSAAGKVRSDWTAIQAAGAEEGSVNIYTVASEAQTGPLVAAFTQKYPDIKVEITRGGGELSARVGSEIATNADGADIYVVNNGLFLADNADNTIPLVGPSIDAWPKDAWDVPEKAPAIYHGVFAALAWNTNTFPDGFTSFEQMLTDPAVKGKLGLMTRPNANTDGYLAGAYEFLETQVPDLLPKLAGLDSKIYPSSIPIMQAIASGEVGASPFVSISTLLALKNQGAPIAFAIPNPAFALPWGAAIVSNSRRPNAAMVFMDFMTSLDGQKTITGNGTHGVSALDFPQSVALDQLKLLDFARFTPDVIDGWSKKVEGALLR